MSIGRKRSIYNTFPSKDKHDYEYYRNIKDFVKRFVDHAGTRAMNVIDYMDDISTDTTAQITSSRSLSWFGTEWPSCDKFNVRNGLECVQREMRKWNELPSLKNWMFHVDFISLKRETTTEFYTYEVLWSIPTPAYPEPQVTVSVFFCIAASLVHPYFPLDVTYVFEGHQFVHRPIMIFRPKWLYDILDMKTMIFRKLDF